MLKQLLLRLAYPNKYSSDAYIRYIRSRGASVGKGCKLYGSTTILIDEGYLSFIRIGDDVHISKSVTILAHDQSYQVLERMEAKVSFRPQYFTTIGNNVFIGMYAIILPGATIGNNCIIGANAVVSGNIPDGSVAAGNPARVICTIDEYREKLKKRFRRSAIIWCQGKYRERKTDISIDDMIIYKTLIKGHENDFGGINAKELANMELFSSFDEILQLCEEKSFHQDM